MQAKYKGARPSRVSNSNPGVVGVRVQGIPEFHDATSDWPINLKPMNGLVRILREKGVASRLLQIVGEENRTSALGIGKIHKVASDVEGISPGDIVLYKQHEGQDKFFRLSDDRHEVLINSRYVVAVVNA